MKNCVVYLGTHDNNTTKGHFETMEEGKLNAFKEYLGVKSDNFDEMVDRSIRALMGSVADLCVVSTQDLLRQGSEYRMNVPGLDDDNINWKYQLSEPLSKELGDYLKDMITIYERD